VTPERREKGMVHGPRVLVLAPTRELAMQVAKAVSTYGRHVPGLRVASVVGGVPYGAQLKALRGPLDMLIATPGRLMDHMASGKAVLAKCRNAGARRSRPHARHGLHRRHPPHRPLPRRARRDDQRHLRRPGRPLAAELLRDPQRIDVASHTDTHADIEQRLHWADDLRTRTRCWTTS
jgi:superfamily II DNA/RNA helicase